MLNRATVVVNQHHRLLEKQLSELERQGVALAVSDTTTSSSPRSVLHNLVGKEGRDFVLFAQNDQVLEHREIGETIRSLRCGYSSFSGIDDSQYDDQTRQCLDDLVAGKGTLDLPAGRALTLPQPTSGGPGFSLVFDTEQMAGVRFGLPRILDLLDAQTVPATFFVTGFVAQMYPDLLPALRQRGHSIGVHSHYHEYLSDMPIETQIERLVLERERLGQSGPVKGANLIFRMNNDTVTALAQSGFQYFVVSMEHTYTPFAYRKLPVHPYPVWTAKGAIWMVPISVETYDRPIQAAKLSLDSALRLARLEHAPTVSVLMHPFRDGSLENIAALEELVLQLETKRAVLPVTLDHVIDRLPAPSPTAYIYVDIGDGAVGGLGPLPRQDIRTWHWEDTSKYWRRIEQLYRSLKRLGQEPVLCVACPQEGPVYAVHPYVPQNEQQQWVSLDPIRTDATDKRLQSQIQQHAEQDKGRVLVFGPERTARTLGSVCSSMMPKQPADWSGIPVEIGVRLTSRLTRSLHRATKAQKGIT